MKTITDFINIELIVQAVQMDEEVWMQGSLEITINEEKPYSESDIIVLDVFFKSMESDGEYFIFSCCCGMPECSGWIKGIAVSHDEKTIKWVNQNNGETWILDKNKIREDLKNIREEVKIFKQFFIKKGIEYVGVGYNW